MGCRVKTKLNRDYGNFKSTPVAVSFTVISQGGGIQMCMFKKATGIALFLVSGTAVLSLLMSCGMDTISPTGPATKTHTGIRNAVEKDAMEGMTETHNRVRARLGLPSLHWSGKLAAIARKRAVNLAVNNNCTMRHTKSELGENLFWASAVKWSDGRRETQKITAQHVAEAWAAESADYDYSTNTCRPGAMCGHYTQMVWKNSRELGCGMAVCPDKAQIWVCVYSPPGNYVGQRPY